MARSFTINLKQDAIYKPEERRDVVLKALEASRELRAITGRGSLESWSTKLTDAAEADGHGELVDVYWDVFLIALSLWEGFNAVVEELGETQISEQPPEKTRRDLAIKAATASLEKNEKRATKRRVMSEIQEEWRKRKDAGDRINATRFAKDMARKHHDQVTIESIKNAQTRWNKEYHPTG